VSRKTSRGVPRYEAEQPDTFVLSGAEDLVPVTIAQDRVGYRPRTEGLFARIEHVHDRSDHWEAGLRFRSRSRRW
jgi:Salmonella virulence plasmid 65kDa B protein